MEFCQKHPKVKVGENEPPCYMCVADDRRARSWPEDYADGENEYMCTCAFCKHTFHGHKRRVVCKLCVAEYTKPAAPAVEWAEAQRVADVPKVHEALAAFSGDPTGDAGVMVVRSILEVLAQEKADGPA